MSPDRDPAPATPTAPPPPTVPGRARAVVRGVSPAEDGGRTALKRVVGEPLTIEADVFADGHDQLSVRLCWRVGGGTHRADGRPWCRRPMDFLGNDRWAATVVPEQVGSLEVAVSAAVDPWASWRHGLAAKRRAGTDRPVDLLVGAALLEAAAARLDSADRRRAARAARRLRDDAADVEATGGAGPDPSPEPPWLVALDQAMADAVDPATVTLTPVATVWVDRALAGAAAWYELFPRSASPDPDRAGTLADVVDRLPYVAGLGFDILYLPPIHPIGRTHRKGRNGAPAAAAGDPGSPWAIGAAEGGHRAVHPELGTVDDLRRLVAEARGYGLEVALDLAFQCSPDHPWVEEHPQWFRHLPDGTIAYAENPPKRYEDIYPLDFDSADWPNLWAALADVVRYWIEQGITVFRVDNPHTKSLRFWEWLMADVRRDRPDVLFLSEAFTRPRLLEQLAKVGFTQSYTYFTWRVAKWEIEEYLRELTATAAVEYLRPNFWPNTPDILPAHLQEGGRPAFVARLVLAAMGSACYGIYGPAFELQEHVPRNPGSEEYLDSEKYEVRHWDWDRPDSLAPLVTQVNAIRRAHPALRQNRNLLVRPTDNDQLVAFVKWSDGPEGTAGRDVIMTVVNLDPRNPQSGWVDVDPGALGLPGDEPYVAHDLLTDTRFEWRGRWSYVALDPGQLPAHVLHLHTPGPRP